MKTSPFTKTELCLFLLFIVIGLSSILAHEIWRDEFQAFLIAKESVSLTDMFQRMQYEGHPPLWHLLLYGITRFSGSPLSMQLLHLAIACISAYLILRFPLPKPERYLLAFGYFPLYEYLAISRNYAPGFLLSILLTYLLLSERRHYFWIAVVMFLLCLCNVYGIIISVSVTAYLLVEYIDRLRNQAGAIRKEAVMAGTVILVAGIALSVMAIAPPKNGYVELPVCMPLEWDFRRCSEAVKIIWRSYIPIPAFQMHFWDTSFFEIRLLRPLLSPVFIAISMACFFPKKRILFLYCFGTLAMLAFSYFVYVGSLRHFGHAYVLFLMCMVLYSATERCGENKFRFFSERTGRKFILFILTAQVIAAGTATFLGWVYPFTAGKAVAAYIRSLPGDYVLVGDRDWAMTTISGYLGKPIYQLVIQRDGTYISWNDERAEILAPFEIVNMANKISADKQKTIIVILNYELEPEDEDNLVKLKSFTRSILPDECFYLYMIAPEHARHTAPTTSDIMQRCLKKTGATVLK